MAIWHRVLHWFYRRRLDRLTRIIVERNKIRETKNRGGQTMTNKEYALTKIQEVVDGLESIKDKIASGENLQNEDWVKCATPLNQAINILGNYNVCKDNEFGSDRYSRLCQIKEGGEK